MAERERAVELLAQVLIVEAVLRETLAELAEEAVKEGRIAKREAEFVSGIYFPNPAWMQFGPYCLLRDMWKARKAELNRCIERGLPAKKKFEVELAQMMGETEEQDLMQALQLKRLKAIERKRQKKLCAEMAAEEAMCRKFYHWELLQNLRERRQMRLEEMQTKQFLAEYERLKRAALSNYNVSHFSLEEQEKLTKISAFERRRLELKAVTLERRKIAEEVVLMGFEDQFSEALRIFDRMERQRKQLQEDSDEDDSDGEYIGGKGRRVKIPKWLLLPSNWLDLSLTDQLAYIFRMEKWRTRMLAIERKVDRDRRRLIALEAKSLEDWQRLYDVFIHKSWTSELAYMGSREEYEEARRQLVDLEENIRRLTVFCQQKGGEELKVKYILYQRTELARKRDRELAEATTWLEQSLLKFRKRRNLKLLMDKQCLGPIPARSTATLKDTKPRSLGRASSSSISQNWFMVL